VLPSRARAQVPDHIESGAVAQLHVQNDGVDPFMVGNIRKDLSRLADAAGQEVRPAESKCFERGPDGFGEQQIVF
jgi:hypothetical protein